MKNVQLYIEREEIRNAYAGKTEEILAKGRAEREATDSKYRAEATAKAAAIGGGIGSLVGLGPIVISGLSLRDASSATTVEEDDCSETPGGKLYAPCPSLILALLPSTAL